MRFPTLVFVSLSLLIPFLTGCGSNTAQVKGKLIENGKSRTFEQTQAAIQLTLIGSDGQLDNAHSYTAVVNNDGGFEVVASGGELPLGKYQVAVVYRGNDPKYQALYAPDSKVRRDIKAGANDLVIDLTGEKTD